MHIDNNLVENSIRPNALGRKNYLFAGSDEGAKRSAMFYSFLGTCKMNGVNPQDWLTHVLSNIAIIKSINYMNFFLRILLRNLRCSWWVGYHLVVNFDDPFELVDVIRDFKRHTVKQLLFQIRNEPESRRDWMIELLQINGEKVNQQFKFWKSGNHAIVLYSKKFVWDKINIHNNSVEVSFF